MHLPSSPPNRIHDNPPPTTPTQPSPAQHSGDNGEETQGCHTAHDPSEGPQRKRQRVEQSQDPANNPPAPSQAIGKKGGKGGGGGRPVRKKPQTGPAGQNSERRTSARVSAKSCESYSKHLFLQLPVLLLTISQTGFLSIRRSTSTSRRVKAGITAFLIFIGYHRCYISTVPQYDLFLRLKIRVEHCSFQDGLQQDNTITMSSHICNVLSHLQCPLAFVMFSCNCNSHLPFLYQSSGNNKST